MTQHVSPPDDSDEADENEIPTETLIEEISAAKGLPEPEIHRDIGMGYRVTYEGGLYGFRLSDHGLFCAHSKANHIEYQIELLIQAVDP